MENSGSNRLNTPLKHKKFTNASVLGRFTGNSSVVGAVPLNLVLSLSLTGVRTGLLR